MAKSTIQDKTSDLQDAFGLEVVVDVPGGSAEAVGPHVESFKSHVESVGVASYKLDCLEELKTGCRNPVGLLVVVDAEGRHVLSTWVPCHRWSCSRCGVANRRVVVEALHRWMCEWAEVNAMTLTLDPAVLSPGVFGDKKRSSEYAWSAWGLFLKRWKRDSYLHRIKVFCPLEFQKNGTAHFQTFISGRVPLKQVQRMWREVGGGSIDLKYGKTPSAAANYACKAAWYGSKGWADPEWPLNRRRWSCYPRRALLRRPCVADEMRLKNLRCYFASPFKPGWKRYGFSVDGLAVFTEDVLSGAVWLSLDLVDEWELKRGCDAPVCGRGPPVDAGRLSEIDEKCAAAVAWMDRDVVPEDAPDDLFGDLCGGWTDVEEVF